MAEARPQTTRFVLLGASLLSGLAGYVNAIFLALQLLPVSHLTGVLSRLSFDLASGGWPAALEVISIALAFLGGALISGIVIGDSLVRVGRRYGVTLVLEGGVLAVSAWLVAEVPGLAVVLAALACGLQNGMASNYRGMIIRTTHITGTVTDLGVLLGRYLRYRSVNGWQFALLSLTTGAFVVGGSFGIIVLQRYGVLALWLAAWLTLALGLAHLAWTHRLLVRVARKLQSGCSAEAAPAAAEE